MPLNTQCAFPRIQSSISRCPQLEQKWKDRWAYESRPNPLGAHPLIGPGVAQETRWWRGRVKDRPCWSTPVRPSRSTADAAGRYAPRACKPGPSAAEKERGGARKKCGLSSAKQGHPPRADQRRRAGGLRKECPSMTTTWAWWSRRSIAADAISSSRKSGYHSSSARFDVITVELRSYRARITS